MGKISYGCILLLLFQNVQSAINNEIVVETNVGNIKGLNSNDGDYHMYLGIPYAHIGDNPFATSIPYPPFNNTFQANDDSVKCPQINKANNQVVGTLDCLRLNIYVPASASQNNRLPVMVWIHGGLFETGFGGRYLYDPSYLIKHQVIVVTINYRLGPYGFMCLDIPEVSGNQGLKDQYLAMKWIKENIQAFGGNADQITLFGQSAGGHSIDLHLMSARDTLFHKVILQSGSAQALTVLYEPDKTAAITLARYTGLETNDTSESLRHLSKLDTQIIITASKSLKIQFKPCVENNYGVEPFLARSWIDAVVPKVKDMPVLMGFNKLEYASIFIPREAEFLSNSSLVNDRIEQVFDFDKQDANEAKDLVSHFYFGDEKIDKSLKWPLIRFLSDFTYIHPVHRTLKKYLEYEAKNIYFYMFTYVGGRNAVKTSAYDEYDSTGQLCCASHTDELRYLFDGHNNANVTYTDQITIERMTTMWTNFAKYSNPTPKLTELLPVQWMPVTEETYYYYNIDNNLTLGKRPLHTRMAFWDLFYKHNKKSQKQFVKI